MIWDFFDKAFVINLDERQDRMSSIAPRLKSLNIQYERFPAIRPHKLGGFSNLGYYGATLSHLTLWQKIQENHYDNALIIEDDAVFRDDTSDIMHDVIQQLESVDWEILYLGVVPYSTIGKAGPNLRELRRGVHLHAYAVNTKALERMIYVVAQSLSMHNKKVVDVTISKSPIKKFYIDPILAVQNISPSDTGGSHNRLVEYFKYFPVDDFVNHCAEMAHQIGDLTYYRECYQPNKKLIRNRISS